MKLAVNAKHTLLTLSVVAMLGGCVQTHSVQDVENPSNKFYGNQGEHGDLFKHQRAPEEVFAASMDCTDVQHVGANLNYRADKPLKMNTPFQTPLPVNDARFRNVLPLSPGDLIEVYMEHGDGFNGSYVVDNGGFVNLPIVEPVNAYGLVPEQLEDNIELALIRANVFRADTTDVTVKVLQWSSIEVPVSGAVFQPGRVTINERRPSNTIGEKLLANGDVSNHRLLSEAVRAASGIRPDAKLDQVMLLRGGWKVEVDLTGILSGQPVRDYPLIAGDQIIVPSTGCFQSHLVRPSQITPKGFRVFMSNLIDSAKSNSAAAVGRYSTNIPYGTKLLQAAVSANCVGGKEWTNAPRKVVLASTNPITGKTQVIERSVEELMRQSYRDDINPFLMPNDAVACYDSDVTNLRDIAGAIAEVILPFKIL